MNTSTNDVTSRAAKHPRDRRILTSYWLITPGVFWMLLFLVMPMLMMVSVSFWTQTTFGIEPGGVVHHYLVIGHLVQLTIGIADGRTVELEGHVSQHRHERFKPASPVWVCWKSEETTVIAG